MSAQQRHGFGSRASASNIYARRPGERVADAATVSACAIGVWHGRGCDAGVDELAGTDDQSRTRRSLGVAWGNHLGKGVGQAIADGTAKKARLSETGLWVATERSVVRLIPAVTYSPTHLRMQYHRRWQA